MRHVDHNSARTPIDLRNILNRTRWAAKYHGCYGRDYADLRNDEDHERYRAIRFDIAKLRLQLWAKHMAKVHAERQSLSSLLRRQAG